MLNGKGVYLCYTVIEYINVARFLNIFMLHSIQVCLCCTVLECIYVARLLFIFMLHCNWVYIYDAMLHGN